MKNEFETLGALPKRTYYQKVYTFLFGKHKKTKKELMLDQEESLDIFHLNDHKNDKSYFNHIGGF